MRRIGLALSCWLVAAAPAAAQEALARLERTLRERDRAGTVAALEAVRAEDAGAPRAQALLDRLGTLVTVGHRAEVRIAAAGALARLGLPGGYGDAAAAAARDPDPEAAEAAARAMGTLADADALRGCLQALGGEAVRGRILAALALGCSADPRATPALHRALAQDVEAAVRAAAAAGLGRRVDADSVAALVHRLQVEVAPLTQAACVEALEGLTGARFGLDPARWLAAFDAGELRPGAPPADHGSAAPFGHSVPADTLTRWTVTYWGIPVTDDGTVFCVDVSGSMNFHQRLVDARRELGATVARLPSDLRFGVCFFNDRVAWWRPRLTTAGPLAKYLLLQRLDALEARRTTDLFGMLERVFGLLGAGRWPVDPPERLRAVFLLTDGMPSNDYVRDTGYIRAMVRRWNGGGRVRVHTVALALAADDFLRALAADNGGRFVATGERR